VFSATSWITLASPSIAFYAEAFRDIYEAFAVYCFFNLLVVYLDGERGVLTLLYDRPTVHYLWPVSMWQKDMDIGDPYTFLRIKRGILQFVFVKPLCALVTMVLKWMDAYDEGEFHMQSGYFWITLVYNLAYSWCLWCLSMFFIAAGEDLKPFRAIPKFFCIKAVIFFSYWQGVVISLLVRVGLIRNTETFSAEHIAVAVQSFLICMEMFPAAILHYRAFSYKDTDTPTARLPLYHAARDAFGLVDLWKDVKDTVHGKKFNYHMYEPAEGVAAVTRSRIKQGLRYVEGGKRKYWITSDEEERRKERARIKDDMRKEREVARSLGWSTPYTSNSFDSGADSDDVEWWDSDEMDEWNDDQGMQHLWEEARGFKYGDYNCPVVLDEHDRKRWEKQLKAVRKAKRRQADAENGRLSPIVEEAGPSRPRRPKKPTENTYLLSPTNEAEQIQYTAQVWNGP
jgi:hypothetical protein